MTRRSLLTNLTLLLLFLPGFASVRADWLFLRTGEKLIGRVVVEHSTVVVFDSQALRRVEVARDRIDHIELQPDSPNTPLTGQNVSTNSPAPSAPFENQFVPWRTGTAADNFDWIQLKSSEWLKGRMKSLHEDQVEFDSDKLDLQQFDWKDVKTLRLPRLNAVRFEKLGSSSGSVLITTNEVLVMGEGTNSYPRSELVSVTPTGMKERSKWSGELSSGLTVVAGNSRRIDYNGQLEIDRRTPFSHLSFDYIGNLGKSNGEETDNNHRATTQFDYFLSRRFFVLAPFAEYYRDGMQNLDHRITLGAGVGYAVIRTPRTEWGFALGPAFQENWYSSVNEDQSGGNSALALMLGTRFKMDLTERMKLKNEFRALITSREVGESTLHWQSKFEFKIHKRLNLNNSFTWDRVSAPKIDAAGFTPQKDDFRLTTGLGINF